jgi:hypothetical protein
VIDAALGDPDAQLAEYYATTPRDRQARLIVVLADVSSGPLIIDPQAEKQII